MKRFLALWAVLLPLTWGPLGCGGGGGTDDFSTDELEVGFSKSEDTQDLPNVSGKEEDKVEIECGGDKTTEGGSVTITCKDSGISDAFTCDGGEVISDQFGVAGCEKPTFECLGSDEAVLACEV